MTNGGMNNRLHGNYNFLNLLTKHPDPLPNFGAVGMRPLNSPGL